MTPSELEAALRDAFCECDAIGAPLSTQQQQVLLQVLTGFVAQSCAIVPPDSIHANPLDDLTPEQRRRLLNFIQTQNQINRSWKAELLNDWLHNRDSGEMQFIRQRYGLLWLERVQPFHIAQYADEVAMQLKVGDRIEVSNRLWEWVQPDDLENQDWFACTVIGIGKADKFSDDCGSSCNIRFDNGMEYEIQGIYEWNRYNWRWLKH